MNEPSSRTDSLSLPKSIERVVVLGDPHGDLLALSIVLGREKRAGVAILSAGDNVGYSDGRSSSLLCHQLEREKIPSVQGNHESWSESGKLFLAAGGIPGELDAPALTWLRALPARIRITLEAAPELTVSLVHTLPGWEYVNDANADELAEQESAVVTFCGHTHSPGIYTIDVSGKVRSKHLHPRGDVPLRVAIHPGERYVVDAGSLARPSTGGKRARTFLDRGTYASLDVRDRVLRVYSFDKRKQLEELMRREVAENTRRARGSPPRA